MTAPALAGRANFFCGLFCSFPFAPSFAPKLCENSANSFRRSTGLAFAGGPTEAPSAEPFARCRMSEARGVPAASSSSSLALLLRLLTAPFPFPPCGRTRGLNGLRNAAFFCGVATGRFAGVAPLPSVSEPSAP